MSGKWERVVLGGLLGVAAVGGYVAMQNPAIGNVARHAQTVAGVLVRQVGPAIQVASAAGAGDFEPATALAKALISPSAPDIIEPTNDCQREPTLVRVQPLSRTHRVMVLRVRTPRVCKRS